jgi:hypothetical protein
VLKKTKMEMQKNENRKNIRVQLEKQLQSSIEGHITRTVDSYTYICEPDHGNGNGNGNGNGSAIGSGLLLGNTNTITVNAKLLLLHTYERMRILQGKKNLKRFLLSEVSCTLFDEIFWLCFCHFFQKVSSFFRRCLLYLPTETC